ncbi:MAG: hypothetical protein FD149_1273 [Rhodospirillaceae bacterium]|nr:MAG: hypothetical protein FD149_1273 [Rhodospirillaceae bacterium]
MAANSVLVAVSRRLMSILTSRMSALVAASRRSMWVLIAASRPFEVGFGRRFQAFDVGLGCRFQAFEVSLDLVDLDPQPLFRFAHGLVQLGLGGKVRIDRGLPDGLRDRVGMFFGNPTAAQMVCDF